MMQIVGGSREDGSESSGCSQWPNAALGLSTMSIAFKFTSPTTFLSDTEASHREKLHDEISNKRNVRIHRDQSFPCLLTDRETCHVRPLTK